MASIYARGDVLWIKFKDKDGEPKCKSSGYRRGQEALARELADECERQAKLARDPSATAPARMPAESRGARVLSMPSAAATAPIAPTAPPAERIGPDAPAGALTVAVYVETWLKRRVGVETVKDEATRLRLHVVPLIGHMAISDVRPRHIRDLVNAIKQKTSDAPKCKGEALAPRTVRHVFATVRQMFKGAVIDEHIVASPVVLEAGVLPQNMDKDPEWRSTAIFEREELIGCVSDERILMYRRVFYALEGLAGVRHSEGAALCFRDRKKCEPLNKIVVSRSGEKKRTKTKVTREVPEHPTLTGILDEWQAHGWAEKFGRPPMPDDLILPTENNKVRKPSNTLKEFHKDLKRIGLRPRRGHDLRRTFITLVRADGGRSEVLRPLTHPGDRDIIGLYETYPWPVVCAELAKLRIPLPVPASTVDAAPAASSALASSALDQIVDEKPAAAVAGYSPSYSPDCSSEIQNNLDNLAAAANMGQRFRKP